MRILFSLVLLLRVAIPAAQKVEQGFDYAFKPTDGAPRYYVLTEKKDTLWHRLAWYLPERGPAMEGWYRDKEATVAQGEVTWYYPDKRLQSKGSYVNGKKEGTWLEYGEEGSMRDSATYTGGRLKGVRMHWHPNGMPADSVQFDGNGNGTEVSWDEEGRISAAGYWISDTLKRGRWKYYHPNGIVLATEDYAGGKRIDWACFDDKGTPLDTTACPEQEASFSGGINGWIRFIQRNLKSDVPVKRGAPVGQYTVVVQFVVDTDGTAGQVKSNTHFGYGMEEEVERMIKSAPRWVPAQQYGRKVKAYRKQPVTFVVANG